MGKPFRLYRGRREPAIQGEYFVGGAGLPQGILRGERRIKARKVAPSAVSHEIMAFSEPSAKVTSSPPMTRVL